jgi:phosphoribosylglycinamide formyltransferase-1
MLSVAVLASGRGTNLRALLEAEQGDRLGPASIEVVVSDQDDARALERARRFDVETIVLDPHGKDREA